MVWLVWLAIWCRSNMPSDKTATAASCLAVQGSNKDQWDDPRQLSLLLDAVQARAAGWQQQYLQGQQQQPAPQIGCLLQGFFHLWSGPLSDWVLGRNR
jgi:hypothetical protein